MDQSRKECPLTVVRRDDVAQFAVDLLESASRTSVSSKVPRLYLRVSGGTISNSACSPEARASRADWGARPRGIPSLYAVGTSPVRRPKEELVSEKISYDLRGSGIEIKYQDGDLSVDGDHHLLRHRHFGADDERPLTVTTTELGHLVTAELLESTRSGTRITLSLLLPQVVLTNDATDSEVTGAAIITRQHHDDVNPPPVLHDYEVRPLTGSASRTPT